MREKGTLPSRYSFEILVELEGIIIKMTYISNEIRDQLLLDKASQFAPKRNTQVAFN